ncbi:S9 family peptidase [Gramella sp. KN1008]|uniref:alpha/beta hydrolase family protein n=1 Tax=Gramella sp. KN1008 TaxID=2529298 RepID=UPI0013F168E7|nr:alpha/beta hydrolase [Gramella sp. KN1008]
MTIYKGYFPILFLLIPFLVSAQKPLDFEKAIINSKLYDYLDIQFQNVEDDLKLEGTLIIPKESYSQIVLIVPGSDRNTRFAHHKLAQEFLNKNIGVFRFDDRGIGESEGKFNPFGANSLALDIKYAIHKLNSLPGFEEKKIGVLGHSLGAIAAVKATSITNDIDYIIQLSAPVKNPSYSFKYQAVQNLNGRYNFKDKSVKEIRHLFDTLTILTQKNFKNDNYKEVRNKGVKVIKNLDFKVGNIPWTYSYIDLIKDDLDQFYKNLEVPLLFLIGSEDKYVDPISETELISGYKNSLITYKTLEGLNHYFLSEKPTLENIYNVDENASNIIFEWLAANIK